MGRKAQPWDIVKESVFQLKEQIMTLYKNPNLKTRNRRDYRESSEKAMAPHCSTLAWKVPWTEEPGGLQSIGSLRVGDNWVTSLSLFTFMHWRRKWQPTPVFLPGKSQGQKSLVGCCLWGRTESDMTVSTQQQQQQRESFCWSNQQRGQQSEIRSEMRKARKYKALWSMVRVYILL